MTKVITIGNFKGGVGKTTTCVMLSYLLQQEDHKVLLVDFDPQANATSIIGKTFDADPASVKVPFFNGLENGNLSESIVKCNDNLDMIPADWDLAQLAGVLSQYENKERFFILKYLLDEIKDAYDYVIIDTPPTVSDYTNNALAACDYFLIIMQTQEQSFTSSMKFINYALKFREDYGLSYDLLGIVPYLVDRRGSVDNQIIKQANRDYAGVLTTNIIYNRQRIKRYGHDGIKPTNPNRGWDNWDEEVLNMYRFLLGELIGKLKLREVK